MSPPLSGVLPVLHMPYLEDFSIDYDVLAAEIDYAFACGAQGITFALASEMLRLTGEERLRVAEFLVGSSQGRGPVIISIGAESNYAAVRFARHAEEVGATALMAIPPLATPLDEAQLRGYFGAILQATSIPLVVQDASAYVGQAMSTDFQISLWREWGDRVAFKPEAAPVGPVISALRRATGGEAIILEGSGGSMLVENFRRGLSGTMPGTDLLDGVLALWGALESNDEDRVYAIGPLLGSILALASGLDGYIAIEKHLMVRHGIFKNTLARLPVSFSLDQAAAAELDRLWTRLQNVLRH